ncbi:hypothetical protein QVD99_8723 [Batrachochytrium dendrobatidis]|nr:hypothetical protein O5D80_005634 [Batrachochytrium dendrobatidis]KAK5669774.1 hypothetical protein QVD99_8723 [Batrachochytrium dendrobatidis]
MSTKLQVNSLPRSTAISNPSRETRVMTYRRRLLNPRSNITSQRWKVIRIVAVAGICVCSMSAALFFDFGDTPHVFQPLRKLYQEKRLEFLSLSDQDILELKLRGKL